MKLNLKKKKPESKIKYYNWLLYGQEKFGKTYLTARLPNSHFLSFEDGTKFVGVDVSENYLKSWDELIEVASDIVKENGAGLDFVIMDRIESGVSLCETYITKKENADKFQKIGFGRGWSECRKEILRVFNALNRVGVGVVALSLNKKQDFIKDGQTQYNIWTPNLSGSYLKEIGGFFDFVTYGYFNKEGQRVLATSDCQDAVVGCRLGEIAPRVKSDYQEWDKAVNEAYEKFLSEGKKSNAKENKK